MRLTLILLMSRFLVILGLILLIRAGWIIIIARSGLWEVGNRLLNRPIWCDG